MFDEFYFEISKCKDIKLELISREKVAKYIMCTKHHFDKTTYEDNDLNYVLDFDLNEFTNEDFNEFYEISKKIYFEFSFHGEDQLRKGRTAFLEMVLQKDRIFRTDEFHNK